MNIDKFVTDLTKNPSKAIVYAVLLVLGIILLYWLWTKIKGGVSSLAEQITNVTENPVESSNLSYSQDWYKNNAENVFNAMNGLSTNVSVIDGILKSLKNQDDYNALNKAYGTRTLENFLSADEKGTMLEHLYSDMGASYMNNIQIWLRNARGIEMH
jgi:hypothetical protein